MLLWIRRNCLLFKLYPYLYGKTFFRLVSFFFTTLNNKFFSIYNYLFRFYFCLFGFQWTFSSTFIDLVGLSGLEPPTSRLSGARSNQLSYKPISEVLLIHLIPFCHFRDWWRWWDSNPWPPACRAGALPTELHPHNEVPLAGCWHRPIFPSRFQLSIFGTAQLNFCVRNGNRWTLCVSGTNYYFYSVTENWTTNRFDLRPTVTFWVTVTFSIERRWSSRTFRYGYLVTT